ncbi:hypothetical protein TNCV_2787161 [Trichonephila clavipes]|nr:hypothetical protein TNCV_2787161 [Trichonephila clavipes]
MNKNIHGQKTVRVLGCNLDSDEIGIEIVVLPLDASELYDEDEGDENEVNFHAINESAVPWSLVVRT